MSGVLRGKSQVDENFPISSSRKPAKTYDFPGRRAVHDDEAVAWRFMKKWELQMKAEWDDLEQFRSQPKPKKQFGNEAAEIVWPYAVLLENVIKIHPFTKSVYCYYGQRHLTPAGEASNQLAIRLARECLIPITFHNSQCYVETEMLLEYNDNPWVVVHCLDGRQSIVPIISSGSPNEKEELLKRILDTAASMGETVEDPQGMFRVLNERPNQNHYVRVDYQWMGNTAEERMQHTVQWYTEDKSESDEKLRFRDYRSADWLSLESGRSLMKMDRGVRWKHEVSQRKSKEQQIAYFRFQARVASAMYSRYGNRDVR